MLKSKKKYSKYNIMTNRSYFKSAKEKSIISNFELNFHTLRIFNSSDTLLNKRDNILSLIYDSEKQNYIPGAFFMHFGKETFFGESAINKHLDFFHNADLDILKIQYEQRFPIVPEIQKPSDWNKVPFLKKDFYAEQLNVIKEIVKRGKKEALVIATVYSPLTFAGHFTGEKYHINRLHINHLNEDPDLVKKGLEIITESILIFVKECIKLGVDGFFQTTQGGESKRFTNDTIFEDYIKPLDLIISQEMDAKCQCNILHIHAGEGKYKDYSAFTGYPNHIVNCELELEDGTISTKELYKIFNRPVMGGLTRNGIIVEGTKNEIAQSVKQVIAEAPEKFILGANCTIPEQTNWANVKVAIDTAHNYFKN